ncbi:hypothetical protein D3C86_1924420 [compost metagenome]
MGISDDLFSVVRRAKHRDQPRPGRAKGNWPGGNGQPPLNLCRCNWIGWQPAAIAIFLRQINQNCIGIGQQNALIINDRNLTKRIERQEARLLVLALSQIDQDQLGR